MRKMIKSRLTEVRNNLGNLTAQASLHGPLVFFDSLDVALRELGKARESIFRPSRAKIADMIAAATEIIAPPLVTVTIKAETSVTVRPRAPERFEIPSPPSHVRRVPISTSYHAERYIPYRILWSKVIIRATYDYALWRDSKDMRLKKCAQDAERWLFEPSDIELSFENICYAYDFPMAHIRKKTRLLTKHDVKKLEFRERQGKVKQLPGDTTGGDSK